MTARPEPPTMNGIPMKKLLLVSVIIVVVYIGWSQVDRPKDFSDRTNQGGQALSGSFDQRNSGNQVEGYGIVVKILTDDTEGIRHQRFILKLNSGQTLLIAHNIDLAPRISSLQEGDAVTFYGEYEWNPKGGVVHWTHHDPDGHHVAGWLKHNGQLYQ